MALISRVPSPPRLRSPRASAVAVAAAGSLGALAAHAILPGIGALTWAVFGGAVAANTGLVPAAARPGLPAVTRRALRAGVVLLGLSLSIGAIADLGAPMLALVMVTLTSTLVATNLLGQRLGLGRPRSLLIATGFAICGASAIAAMEENAEADEDDVAAAIAMVTLFGTLAMVALPVLRAPLGLGAEEYGAWAGASVHEVGQVVAAAGPAGAAAVSTAIVVKLTRVLLLAPVVAVVSARRRRRAKREAATAAAVALPPLVPLFVLGFLGCVALRSVGAVPAAALGPIGTAQSLVLGAALFGMGAGVRVSAVVRGSGRLIALAAVSTVVVAGVALGGVELLG